jgi:hypothetical protein
VGKGGIALGVPSIGVLGRDFGIGMVTKVIFKIEISPLRPGVSVILKL